MIEDIEPDEALARLLPTFGEATWNCLPRSPVQPYPRTSLVLALFTVGTMATAQPAPPPSAGKLTPDQEA